MANNKIIYGNQTLIDLTDDTVSANNLLSGATAHDRSGTQIVGSVSVPTNLDDLSDVNISSPTSGQALVYDSGNSEWVNGTVSGGHVIENDSGTDLTQRSNLQFKGTYSQDDSTNDRTIVNVTRTMTSQQFGQLASAEKAGLIIVTDDPASELDAEDISYDNTSSGLTATDVQGAIDEISGELEDLAFTKTAVGVTNGEYGYFSISFTYGGTTYDNVPILGIKVQGNSDLMNRFTYIGQVVGGALVGRFVATSTVGTVMISNG